MKEPKVRSKSVKKENNSKTKPVRKGRKAKEEEMPPAESIPKTQCSIQVQGKQVKVKMHKTYTISVGSELEKNIRNLVHLYEQKEKRKSRAVYEVTEFSYFPTFQFELAGEKPDQEKCSICQFEYDVLTPKQIEDELVGDGENDIVSLPCSHLMHYGCLKQLIGDKQWIKCPVCSTIYGTMIGDQPKGTMTWSKNDMARCDGYPECGTIVINYSMASGKRGDIQFPGTHRTAYLPDNKEGNEVLNLLDEAFKRKLIFTIGRSVTTGRDNQIVWNGIHHKTNTTGGSSHFGYPDPTYFSRVKLQLAAKGVHLHEQSQSTE